MKQIKVKILGAELEAPLLSLKTAKRYEEGVKAVVDKANAAKSIESGAGAIEAQCNAVIEFIDSVFGPGSSKKVFGDETDLLTCLDAFDEMVKLYEAQVNPLIQQYASKAKAE